MVADEQMRQFQFHGSQIGRAKAAFEAGGFIPQVSSLGNGMYLIVVLLPSSVGAVDWSTLDGWQHGQRKRRRWTKTLTRFAIIAAVVAAVAAAGYFGFQMAAAMGIPAPWSESKQQPAAPQADEGGGFQLPELKLFDKPQEAPPPLLDSATKPLKDAANGVMMVLQAIVVLCVLIGLYMARGVIAALLGGVMGLAKGLGSLAGKGKGQ